MNFMLIPLIWCRGRIYPTQVILVTLLSGSMNRAPTYCSLQITYHYISIRCTLYAKMRDTRYEFSFSFLTIYYILYTNLNGGKYERKYFGN
jgi:hypothetical protein